MAKKKAPEPEPKKRVRVPHPAEDTTFEFFDFGVEVIHTSEASIAVLKLNLGAESSYSEDEVHYPIRTWTATAKRNPVDDPNVIIGDMLAVSRVLEKAQRQLTRHAEGLVKTADANAQARAAAKASGKKEKWLKVQEEKKAAKKKKKGPKPTEEDVPFLPPALDVFDGISIPSSEDLRKAWEEEGFLGAINLINPIRKNGDADVRS